MTSKSLLPMVALTAILSAALLSSAALAQRTGDKPAPAVEAQKKPSADVAASRASPCKGLTQPQCSANPTCTYVKESVRKASGKKIAAYCRLKSKGKKS